MCAPRAVRPRPSPPPPTDLCLPAAQTCREVFNFSVPPAVEWVASNYGDLHLSSTNTVMSNGNIDPWHSLGVVSNSTLPNVPSQVAVFIDGTAHCGDMYAASEFDLPSLQEAHAVIAAHVASWLA